MVVSRVQAPEIVDHHISFKHLSVVGLTKSFTEFKLRDREEESFDKRNGHQNFGICEIENHGDEQSRIFKVKILESI
jgi:hypothetical protein